MMRETLLVICRFGGVAVIFHGYTRATSDLDFWYNPTISNFHKIIAAFKEYGLDVSELEQIVFDSKKTFLRFPVAEMNAEFLPTIPGEFSFREARVKSETVTLDEVEIRIIGYDDLVRNKSATNRLKDQADIDELAKRKRSRKKGRGL